MVPIVRPLGPTPRLTGFASHRGGDGLWYSYAQWPGAEARTNAFSAGPVDPVAAEQMRAAIAESFPEVALESVSDFLAYPDDDYETAQETLPGN